MVRVTGIEDAHTIVVEDAGIRQRVTLGGVVITDAGAAKTLLEWTLVSRWVMLEQRGSAYFVYRSPDALFVNRELVARGYARASMQEVEPETHLIVTYLGVIDPPAVRRPSEKKVPPKAAVRPAPARGSGSAPTRRPPARPSRRRRVP